MAQDTVHITRQPGISSEMLRVHGLFQICAMHACMPYTTARPPE
jgi:hypothetical protein